MECNWLGNASKGITWGVANIIVNLLFSFVSRTAIVFFLGIEYVGLNSLFASILQVLNFTELGLGSALVYCMYKPMAEHDTVAVNSLLLFYKKCYSVIGTVVLGLGILLIPFLGELVNGVLPDDINLVVLYILNLINTVIGYYLFSYKISILNALQRTDISSKIKICVTLLQNVAQVIILLVWKSFYIYFCVTIFGTVCYNLLSAWTVKRKYSDYKAEGKLDLHYKQTIKRKVAGVVCQKLGSVILISADSIIISSFLGLQVLGKYNFYYYIISALIQLIGACNVAIIPIIGNYIVLKSVKDSFKLFKKIECIYMFVLVFLCGCLTGIYQTFMYLWIGKENVFSLDMVFLFIIYFYAYRMADPLGIYLEAAGMWWEIRFVPLIVATINLITNVFLVNLIGIQGVLISTIISLLFIDFPSKTYILFKHYFKDMRNMRGYLFEKGFNVICCIVICIVIYISTGIFGTKIGGLFIRGIISVGISVAMLFIYNFKNPYFVEVVRYIYDIAIGKIKNLSEEKLK